MAPVCARLRPCSASARQFLAFSAVYRLYAQQCAHYPVLAQVPSNLHLAWPTSLAIDVAAYRRVVRPMRPTLI